MSLDALKQVVGKQGWLSEPDDLEPYLHEWRGTWTGKAALMLLPNSTDEVAEILRLCTAGSISVVPQGGNTGLCGGAIPDNSGQQVLLSLRRMQRIRSIDADNFSLVAEAGCVLADIQKAASNAQRFFPLSLAAEGSCQIGGNLSTNAGGVNVLRYGTARDQVLGLEVVLPDGRVHHGLRTLRKDTAGYDIKQLFIGAEGTLGIITAASLKLHPAPAGVETAMLRVASAPQAVSLLSHLRSLLADRLQAYELLSARAVELVLRHVPGTRDPLAGDAPWYVLLEASDCDGDRLQDALQQVLEDSLAVDAMIAKNDREREELWRVRHAVSEAQKPEGASLKHDVSVPVGDVGRFIDAATAAVEKACPGVRVVAFGHVGDGNVHFNLTQPPDWEAGQFLDEREAMARVVYEVVAGYNGSFSAEHGVGVLKRGELERYRGGVELALMRTIKQALDPQNIMNPGKVL